MGRTRDQDVDGACLGADVIKHGIEPVAIRDIAGCGESLAACLLDFTATGVDGIAAATVDRDSCSETGETLRCRPA